MSDNSTNGLQEALRRAFPFWSDKDDKEAGVSYESGASYGASNFQERSESPSDKSGSLTKEGRKDRERFHIRKLPEDRYMLYEIFKEMSEDSTIDAALNIHLGHALSASDKNGLAVFLHPKSEEHAEYVAQLNREVMAAINMEIMNWSYPMLVFGVNYVRPYVQQGKGITHFESNFYTQAKQIREYERAGVLCGFTSEHLKVRENGEQVRLAEPWALIPLKMPVWRPNMDKEPVNYTGQAYSLFDDAYSRQPIEAQNYGTSILHSTYESWEMLRQSIASLGASRVNASLIDRLVGVNTAGLDSAGAAEYVNLLAAQMQSDRQKIVKNSRKQGFIPTVINTLIPLMTEGKGGVQIDTFTTDPNISHIEDIMFHLKRMAASIGLDPSMLGFGDLLSGGLGEGGFLRTSIQSALRAHQIRAAVARFVRRSIDIHTIHRDGKYWPMGEEPFEIQFNSVNTAVAQEEAANQEAKANYATIFATVLDLIEQSPIGNSESIKNHIYTSVLEIDPELAKAAIKELAKSASENDSMLESLGTADRHEAEMFVRDTMLELMSEIQHIPQGDN